MAQFPAGELTAWHPHNTRPILLDCCAYCQLLLDCSTYKTAEVGPKIAPPLLISQQSYLCFVGPVLHRHRLSQKPEKLFLHKSLAVTLLSYKMLWRIPSLALKFVGLSYVVWVLLSTVIPQIELKYTDPQIKTNKYQKSSYPYNSITSPTPLPIQNTTVYYIIGHPDDEVMFFLPSLIENSKPKHNNHVKIICFSRGDAVDESFGTIRSEELIQSARIMGVKQEDVFVLNKYKDGMDIHWKEDDILASLSSIINPNDPVVLITFDAEGVSNHSNHISLFHGTKKHYKTKLSKNPDARLYVLKSLNFLEKYSFTLLTNVELFVDHLSKLVMKNLLNIDINVSFFSSTTQSQKSLKFYSDLNMLSVSYAAMAYGHFSQMVWFRYGWLIFSRYLTFNHLIQL